MKKLICFSDHQGQQVGVSAVFRFSFRFLSTWSRSVIFYIFQIKDSIAGVLLAKKHRTVRIWESWTMLRRDRRLQLEKSKNLDEPSNKADIGGYSLWLRSATALYPWWKCIWCGDCNMWIRSYEHRFGWSSATAVDCWLKQTNFSIDLGK